VSGRALGLALGDELVKVLGHECLHLLMRVEHGRARASDPLAPRLA
jgi:hypothetical protein